MSTPHSISLKVMQSELTDIQFIANTIYLEIELQEKKKNLEIEAFQILEPKYKFVFRIF